MPKRIVQDIKPNPKKKPKPEVEEVSSVMLSFKVDKNNNYEIKESIQSTQKEQPVYYPSKKDDLSQPTNKKDHIDEIENDNLQIPARGKSPSGQKYDHLLRPIYDQDESDYEDENSEYPEIDYTSEKELPKKSSTSFSIFNPLTWFRRKNKSEKSDDDDEDSSDDFEDGEDLDEEQESFPKKTNNYDSDESLEDDIDNEPQEESPKHKKNSSKHKKHLPIIFAVVGILILLYAISTIFERAVITINPKTYEYSSLDLPVTLKTEPSESNLPLKIIEFSSEDKIEVEGGEVSEIAIKAQGQVTLYNSYSKSNQYLLPDTRLLSTSGLIYKIKGESVIPGFTTDSKGVKTPGQVTVTVVAEFPGSEYNQGLTDYSILGFRGTAKDKLFYGRSVTETKGGYKGMGANISESQKSEKSDELRKQIESKLLVQAKSNIPEGSVLLDSGYRIEFGEINQDFSSTDKKVALSASGKFYGIIINQKELEDKILDFKNLNEKSRTGLSAKTLDSLSMTIENPKDFDSTDNDVLVKIKGDISFVSNIDQDAIKASLANRKVDDFESILQNEYNNIESASVSMRPTWVRTFPEKVSDIKIKIND